MTKGSGTSVLSIKELVVVFFCFLVSLYFHKIMHKYTKEVLPRRAGSGIDKNETRRRNLDNR